MRVEDIKKIDKRVSETIFERESSEGVKSEDVK